jgi:hypothetical protein
MHTYICTHTTTLTHSLFSTGCAGALSGLGLGERGQQSCPFPQDNSVKIICLFLSNYLFICLFVYLFVYLFICLFIYLFIYCMAETSSWKWTPRHILPSTRIAPTRAARSWFISKSYATGRGTNR